MRSRLATCALLLVAAASAVAARQSAHAWLRLALPSEEFAVHMPEPHFRIRRELPFGDGVTLRPVSFEIPYRGALLSVLSFSKSEPGAPKSLDEFVKGFGHALGKGDGVAKLDPQSVREAKLDGRAGRQFTLVAGGAPGSARVFETEERFYVVLTYGAAEASAVTEHFHNSFTFDRAAADRVALNDTAAASASPAKRPAPLWPVAGGTAIGVLVKNTPGVESSVSDGRLIGGAPDPDAQKSDAPKPPPDTVFTDGPLNGKALLKPQPVYPPIAKAARVQGTVTVQIIVDEEGYVIAAEAVSGHPLLQQATVFAARQARFLPARLGGRLVKVSGVLTYHFVLV